MHAHKTEAIDPVALGYARGLQSVLLKQLLSRNNASETSSLNKGTNIDAAEIGCALGDKVLCVQMHGDASFTGQGVVMESLGLSAYDPSV